MPVHVIEEVPVVSVVVPMEVDPTLGEEDLGDISVLPPPPPLVRQHERTWNHPNRPLPRRPPQEAVRFEDLPPPAPLRRPHRFVIDPSARRSCW